VLKRLPTASAAEHNLGMGAAADVDWRPIEAGHVPDWARLLAAIEAADCENFHLSEGDLLEWLDDPYRSFPAGSIGGWLDGEMIAHGWLLSRTAAAPVHEMQQEGGVHPAFRGRGLGAWLLDWAERSAGPLHEQRYPGQPLALAAGRTTSNTAALALYAAHGYHQARWFLEMTADLAAPGPPCRDPDGYEIRAFTPERAADALAVRNDSFRDHWGSVPSSADKWARMMAQAAFRPAMSFIAYSAAGEPAGIVLCEEWDADTAATGRRDLYVATVGTRRTARGRGVGQALLCRALEAGRAAGFQTSSLDVDADSSTGAVGLYERAGFAVTSTSVALRKPLPQ
jgi:mycothiol synthase